MVAQKNKSCFAVSSFKNVRSTTNDSENALLNHRHRLEHSQPMQVVRSKINAVPFLRLGKNSKEISPKNQIHLISVKM
jgi:hypothetical protein